MSLFKKGVRNLHERVNNTTPETFLETVKDIPIVWLQYRIAFTAEFQQPDTSPCST